MFLTIKLLPIFCCTLFGATPKSVYFQMPKRGFVTLDRDARNCRIMLHDSEVVKGVAGGEAIFVKDCSGWYSNDIAIGISPIGGNTPLRGIRIHLSTQGYRFYGENQSFPSGLPWLMDVDNDGESEVILWESFGDTSLGRLNSAGIIPWAYKYKKNKLTVDPNLTCSLIGAMILVHLQTIENMQLTTRDQGRIEWHDWVINYLEETKNSVCKGRS